MNGLEDIQKDRWDNYANSADGLINYQQWLALPGRNNVHQLYLKYTQGHKILEIGCGAGHFMEALLNDDPSRDVTGLDLSAGMLKLAAERGLKNLVQGSGNSLPFADASFDTVIAPQWVFRYLDAEKGISEAKRVLRPGGLLLFDVPLYTGLFMEGASEAIRKPSRWRKGFANQRLDLNPLSANTWTKRAIQAGFIDVTSTGVLEVPLLTQRLKWAPYIKNPLIKHLCLTVFYQGFAP